MKRNLEFLMRIQILLDLKKTLEARKAQILAKQERKRHEKMAPLRQFVMENYRPVPIDFGSIILFERK